MANRLRYVPKVKKREESLQRQICTYLRLQYPGVIFRSDYASGLKLTMYQAATHKSLQSGRSWPDLFIYKPLQHKDGNYYAGLAVELKKEGTSIVVTRGDNKGKLVADPHIREQMLLLKELRKLGYAAHMAVGFDHAKKIIDWYFMRDQPINGKLF